MSASASRKSTLALVHSAPPVAGASTLVLARDETLRIVTADGRPLVEVGYDAGGPRVRLLPGDACIAVDGTLRVDAESIELRARNGDLRVEAAEEVVILGQVVRIN